PPGLNRDIIYVATELNNIYAFDANSQALLWMRTQGQADVSVLRSGCDNLSPQGIGIEATPVIDRQQSLLFVSYRTNEGTTPKLANPGAAHQWIESLDIRSG